MDHVVKQDNVLCLLKADAKCLIPNRSTNLHTLSFSKQILASGRHTPGSWVILENELKIIEIEEVTGIPALQVLPPILVLLRAFKGEKLDLHRRPLGDRCGKAPPRGAAESGVHFRG